MKNKFNVGDLVSYNNGAEWQPVFRIISFDYDKTGWFRYRLTRSNGIEEKNLAAEHMIYKRFGELSELMFNQCDPKKRQKILMRKKWKQDKTTETTTKC